MRVPGTYKDRGHYARKLAAYTIAAVLFPVHFLCYFAGRFDEVIMIFTSRLHVWSHPCLYKRMDES